jgi:hypothetical protein
MLVKCFSKEDKKIKVSQQFPLRNLPFLTIQVEGNLQNRRETLV